MDTGDCQRRGIMDIVTGGGMMDIEHCQRRGNYGDWTSFSLVSAGSARR